MKKVNSISKIIEKYPEQWVLLGNPILKHDNVLKGHVLFHHEDKKRVLEIAQNEINNYDMIKIIFTGEASKSVRLNIFRVTETA
jgi:hypothetical protein